MKKKTSKRIISIIFYFVLTTVSGLSAHAQLASWPLTGSTAGTGGPGITVHAVTLGTGLSSDYGSHCNSCLNGNLRVWGWANTAASPGSVGAAVTHNKYVEFAFTVNAGAQPVEVTEFKYTVKAGFTSGCGGQGPYNSVRYRIDNGGTAGTLRYMGRKTSPCNAENSTPTLNAATNGTCVTIARNSTNSNGGDASCTSNTFPITVDPGRTIRFRIYVGTNNASSWRTTFGNVIISGTNPLPVNLTAFNVECAENNDVNVKWTTASEQNSDQFIVEKSRDMDHWTEVAAIAAAGNSTSAVNYSITDPQTFGDISYYRLVQRDFDGTERKYDPVSISCFDLENSMIVFPSPTKNDFTIQVTSSETIQNGQFVFVDVTGKIVSEKTFHVVEGKNQFLINDLDLQMGTYFIRMASENRFKPARVIIGL